MNAQEAAREVSYKIMHVVERRYASDPIKGLAVLGALSRLTAVINDEFHNSLVSLEAIEIMAEIVKELKPRLMERGPRGPS